MGDRYIVGCDKKHTNQRALRCRDEDLYIALLVTREM